MSVFYCEHLARVEDSDFVGFYIVNGMEVCDEAAAELEDEEVQPYEVVEYTDRVVVVNTENGATVNTWDLTNKANAYKFAELVNAYIAKGVS